MFSISMYLKLTLLSNLWILARFFFFLFFFHFQKFSCYYLNIDFFILFIQNFYWFYLFIFCNAFFVIFFCYFFTYTESWCNGYVKIMKLLVLYFGLMSPLSPVLCVFSFFFIIFYFVCFFLGGRSFVHIRR